jgi:hypothetical protein
MKKYLLVAALMGISTYSYTNSGGSPAGKSGSPGDNGQTCAGGYCHSSGSPMGGEVIGIMASVDSISDGNTIGITLGVKPNGTSSKVGFMASVEDASGNQLTTSNPGSGAKKVNDYITHTSSGTAVTNDSIHWTFDISGTTFPDSITVYAAINFTNSNGQTSGDYVMTTSKTLYKSAGNNIGFEEEVKSALMVYPNPAADAITVSAEGLVEIRLYNTIGRFLHMDFSATLQNEAVLDVSTLPRGNYILHAEYSDGSIQYKHVVLQ